MKFKCILITGATGSIGSALAQLLAGHGITLHLHGRDQIKLNNLANVCLSKGAVVHSHACDLRNTASILTWINGICDYEIPDLAILTAGMNIHVGLNSEPESWKDTESLIDLNVKGSLAIISALLPGTLKRGYGQIAIFSSLAGYYGLPLTPAYSASKAALKAYGEALRGWLGPKGIKINVVMPGYVKSAMCDDMPGPKPFLLTPERAAKLIVKGLKSNKARISFPFPLNFGTWFLAALPAAISQRIVSWLGYVR